MPRFLHLTQASFYRRNLLLCITPLIDVLSVEPVLYRGNVHTLLGTYCQYIISLKGNIWTQLKNVIYNRNLKMIRMIN